MFTALVSILSLEILFYIYNIKIKPNRQKKTIPFLAQYKNYSQLWGAGGESSLYFLYKPSAYVLRKIKLGSRSSSFLCDSKGSPRDSKSSFDKFCFLHPTVFLFVVKDTIIYRAPAGKRVT